MRSGATSSTTRSSWLRDFHVDGLRLDAVHAIVDRRATHLLEELAAAADALAAGVRRPLSLIAESDLNDPRLVLPREAGGYGLDRPVGDDIHHALHVALTGETQGYYADFAAPGTRWPPPSRRAYFHAGTWSRFRQRTHGRPVDTEPHPGLPVRGLPAGSRPGRQPGRGGPALGQRSRPACWPAARPSC